MDGAALDFTCPRCLETVAERFYGPCAACRVALASLGGPAGVEVERDRFEPAMHVVPNHVATKD